MKRKYIEELAEVKFLSNEDLDWERSIKGDDGNFDYPALQFYDDLKQILNSAGFIRNLVCAEYPITEILPDTSQEFAKQQVDFYIPLMKTVIEVDGNGHKNQLELDKKRDIALRKEGIDVIRISTKEIRQRDYARFKNEFREIYKKYIDKIKQYEYALNADQSQFKIQQGLSTIARFQVFVLELLDRGVLSLSSPAWQFQVKEDNDRQLLKLALKDLNYWIQNVASLFNTRVSLPKTLISISKKNQQKAEDKGVIRIDQNLCKRWDDEVQEEGLYFIRTDFDDEANYFKLKTNETVVYSLSAETHGRNLRFLLANLFGFQDFNGGQLEIIINCLNGQDTIGLLPTSGGKSLTYQLCVLLQPAISFVVVPIKSLMVDQIENLKQKHHITHASYINGDLKSREASERLNAFSEGKYSFMVISPERFQMQGFRDELETINRKSALALAVIDEVHCLSEWGHDFRTSYLALANTIRKYAPSTRFLALTATASSKVLKDVMSELEISSKDVVTISSFTRPELKFDIMPVTKKNRKESLVEVLRSISATHAESDQKGPTVVFTQVVNGKEGCYELSHLAEIAANVRTGYYSGSQPKKYTGRSYTEDKDRTQRMFMNDEIDSLFATKAFGMGIDKANIRHTIHYGIPNSLESFYQEAGRAGRDKYPSRCLVLYTKDDLTPFQEKALFSLETNTAAIEKARKEVSGDLSTLLFFMKENLMEVEREAQQITAFYDKNIANKKGTVRIGFGQKEDAEKMIYKLALIGIVEDWTNDWRSRHYEVELADWTEASVIGKLSEHIRKYDYGFSVSENQLTASDEPFVKKVLLILLQWYNDNIIYSRKRSMLLMKQVADEFTDSESLQKRIETYFKRNDDVYFLENTAAKKEKIKDWYRVFYVQEEGKEDVPRAINSIDELEITLGRFLESYRDDISLNLISGFVQLVKNNFESVDGRARMGAAVTRIVQMEDKDRQEMIGSILKISDLYLNDGQKQELSNTLISNGLNQMADLKLIHRRLQDEFSYGSMVKELYSVIKERAGGGYPWEM
ncbi:RecQ family ATP-dependent DNA helicase [Planococcus lenghuensis]|uniref:RecQ family ATP-dependent DNA helicase n=1 Tax=Planococcus lenghuensis TaxID=2213202 RepID=UPI001E633C6B|nr:RecQ family ATP-dependent DNA helicase [Planococcus lenghuensis]